ncbi:MULTISPECIES: lipopolysaccharide biosynthesis protein [Thiorhodovibrio]|uniref:lipopolysaccharide biosynthesis protein n=1 Tax=Thiorhodovibrio TaxID=61593 RepID=UPI001913ED2D|nr:MULTISPECIES: oligosaccharide flippase family protein [Thiorhodovibrio]
MNARLFGGPAKAVFQGMGTLALGTGLARLIGVASIPVLTRIYSPEDFGILSIFTAVISMIVPVLTLRYVVAIPLPRHDGMAMNIMALSAASIFTITLVISVGLWFFGPLLLGLMSMEVLAPYWWLIALGAFGIGTYELLSMWATRRKAYKDVAQTQVFQSAIGSLIKIGLGLLAIKPLGLLLGHVIAQSGGIGSFILRFWPDFRRTKRMITRQRMRFAAGYFRGFPVFRLPSQFLLVFSMQAPLLFTAAVYGADATGALGLALTALAFPMSLFGRTMGKAYYAEVASLGKNRVKEVRSLTISVIKRLFLFSLIPAVALFLMGPFFFQVIFGEEWILAGNIASVLSIYLVGQFISSPVVQLLDVFGRQSDYLLINVLRAIILIILFGAAHKWQLHIMTTFLVYSVGMFLFYILTMLRVMSFVRN